MKLDFEDNGAVKSVTMGDVIHKLQDVPAEEIPELVKSATYIEKWIKKEPFKGPSEWIIDDFKDLIHSSNAKQMEILQKLGYPDWVYSKDIINDTSCTDHYDMAAQFAGFTKRGYWYSTKGENRREPFTEQEWDPVKKENRYRIKEKYADMIKDNLP